MKKKLPETIEHIITDLSNLHCDKLANSLEEKYTQYTSIDFCNLAYILGYDFIKVNSVLKSVKISEIKEETSYFVNGFCVRGRKIKTVLDERANEVNENGWYKPESKFFAMLKITDSASTTFHKKNEIIDISKQGAGIKSFCDVYDSNFADISEKWRAEYSTWLKKACENGFNLYQLGIGNDTQSKLKNEPPKKLELYISLAYYFGWNYEYLNEIICRYSKFSKLNDFEEEHLIYRGVIDSKKHENILIHNNRDISDFYDRLSFYKDMYSTYLKYLKSTKVSEANYQDYINKRKMRIDQLKEDKYFFNLVLKSYLKSNNDSKVVENVVQAKLESIGITNIQNTGLTEGVRKRFCNYYNHKGYLPTRKHVIVYSLFCAMSYEEINDLLHVMGMNELYSRNPFEGALIYYLNHPAYSVNSECRFVVNNKEDYRKLLEKAKVQNCEYNALFGLFYQFCNNELCDFLKANDIDINDYMCIKNKR